MQLTVRELHAQLTAVITITITISGLTGCGIVD